MIDLLVYCIPTGKTSVDAVVYLCVDERSRGLRFGIKALVVVTLDGL